MVMTIYRILIFFRSLLWHVYSGCPKSSSQLIIDRYTVCLKCDLYDKKNKQCLECGCNINNQKIFLNKLAWADQKCPLNKW